MDSKYVEDGGIDHSVLSSVKYELDTYAVNTFSRKFREQLSREKVKEIVQDVAANVWAKFGYDFFSIEIGLEMSESQWRDKYRIAGLGTESQRRNYYFRSVFNACISELRERKGIDYVEESELDEVAVPEDTELPELVVSDWVDNNKEKLFNYLSKCMSDVRRHIEKAKKFKVETWGTNCSKSCVSYLENRFFDGMKHNDACEVACVKVKDSSGSVLYAEYKSLLLECVKDKVESIKEADGGKL